jgi:hypothetical protein
LDGFFLTSSARNHQVNRGPSTCISNLRANKFSGIFKQSAIHLIPPSIINCGIYYCLYIPSFLFDGCFISRRESLSLSKGVNHQVKRRKANKCEWMKEKNQTKQKRWWAKDEKLSSSSSSIFSFVLLFFLNISDVREREMLHS